MSYPNYSNVQNATLEVSKVNLQRSLKTNYVGECSHGVKRITKLRQRSGIVRLSHKKGSTLHGLA